MGTPAADMLVSDKSWDHDMPERQPKVGSDIKNLFYKCSYETHYLEMRDGIRIAVDALVPHFCRQGVEVPAVFIQCRYMRSVEMRWPIKWLTNGLPTDLISQNLKSSLVAAGYAVISCDVRGTGASFGQWTGLWTKDERNDAVEVLDWIVQQTWSSGKVALSGLSYEATAALFALGKHHPAVEGAVLLYPFWDLYSDISCAGGVPHKRFLVNWSAVLKSLDKNDLGVLSSLLRIIFSGVQPVVEAERPSSWIFGLQDWKAWFRFQMAKRTSLKLLEDAVAGHVNFSPMMAVDTMRFADQMSSHSGFIIAASSACTVAPDIAAANVPMLVMAGWMDASAAPAIAAFVHTAKAPGSRLILGPWTHGGLLNNSVGHIPAGVTSKFNRMEYILRFLEQTFGAPQPAKTLSRDSKTAAASSGTQNSGLPVAANLVASAVAPASTPTEPIGQGQGPALPAAESRVNEADPVVFFTMGHRAGWRSAPSWPSPPAASTSLFLSGDATAGSGRLATALPASSQRSEHVIQARSCPQGRSRYDTMTDLQHQLKYEALDSCGHLLYTGQPLEAPLEVTGWAEAILWVESCDEDADLFCYLESYDPVTGSVAYVTEGVFRASHRRLVPASEDPDREYTLPPGLPHHSFKEADALPMPLGKPVCCHFTLLPTSFRFAPGHCVRVAVSGADGKHFYADRAADGSRKLWIHAGGDRGSRILLPSMESHCRSAASSFSRM